MKLIQNWTLYGSIALAVAFFPCAATSQVFDTEEYDGDGYVEPQRKKKDQAIEEQAEVVNVLTEQTASITGPKRTIAVGKFAATGAFTEKYGQWDIGGGLAAMLVTALLETDQFIVVERANINQVLSEQDMKTSGVTSQGTGPTAGRLIGANLLVYGAVTEFGTRDSGSESGVGMSDNGGGLTGALMSGSYTYKRTKGKIAMDIRIVDPSTGRILSSHSVNKKLKGSSHDFAVGYEQMEFGHGIFMNTPIGQASREVITQAVKEIIDNAQKTEWVGSVVEFDGKELYINSGKSSGVRVGDKFVVERITKKLTDPNTGEVLGIRKKQLGMLEITGAEEKLAYGNYSPVEMEAPERGDRVVELEPQQEKP